MVLFSKLKLYYPWKMHGYPQFSFWVRKALVKFSFLYIVLNRAKIVGTTHRKPEYLEMRRKDAE